MHCVKYDPYDLELLGGLEVMGLECDSRKVMGFVLLLEHPLQVVGNRGGKRCSMSILCVSRLESQEIFTDSCIKEVTCVSLELKTSPGRDSAELVTSTASPKFLDVISSTVSDKRSGGDEHAVRCCLPLRVRWG